MKYRRRPTIVEAEQWFPGKAVAGVHQEDEFGLNPGQFYVTTIHGQRTYLTAGDWIITEPGGKGHYPCKAEVFSATYDPVE